MTDWQLTTPVAFLIFNRPETTARVFAEIARAKPPVLLVVGDGPRSDVTGEAERCADARAIVENGVNWSCDVRTNYAESNLGCKRRVSSGLDWVFDAVQEAVILEDDCLPHPTFFRFCEELLERYRNDERVMAISGQNVQFGRKRTKYSYYFSRYNHVWGWASWRRAWQHYDIDMSLWPQISDAGWLSDILGDPLTVRYWAAAFQKAHDGSMDSWDYAWTLACWIHSGLSILPNVNLISNIGFGTDSTHTTSVSAVSYLPVAAMAFPLAHPPFTIRDAAADTFTQATVFGSSISLVSRLKRVVCHLLEGRKHDT